MCPQSYSISIFSGDDLIVYLQPPSIEEFFNRPR
jgi:hypothetical protein